MDKEDLILEKLSIIEGRLAILLDRVESGEARASKVKELLDLFVPMAGAWLAGQMAKHGAHEGAYNAAAGCPAWPGCKTPETP